MDRKIVDKTYEAVGCMPKDLCNLIGAYAVEIPYVWNALGLTNLADGTNIDNNMAACTDAGNNGTDLRLYEDAESAWYRFVSETTISCGCQEWTIDFPRPSAYTGWIGVGVTTGPSNSIGNYNNRGFQAMAGPDDWIISVRRSAASIFHAGVESDIRFYAAGPSDVVRATFSADATTGCITVRLVGMNPNRVFDLSDFGDGTTFKTLRPCVVLAGPMYAVVRTGNLFGPTDSPGFRTKVEQAHITVDIARDVMQKAVIA